MFASSAAKIIRLLVALVLVGWLGACGDAPDESAVKQVVEDRLASALEAGTFSLTSLNRLGSGPLADTSDGKTQRIVYYNAVLTFERDLDFSAWDTLNIAAFANLLGATEKGITGLEQGGNHKGDRIFVHGTATFVEDKVGWVPVAHVAPDVGTPVTEYNTGPPAQSRRLIEQIAALSKRQTADPERQRVIISEGLQSAYSTITSRLARLDRAFIVAGGATGGEYIRIARLLADGMAAQGVTATTVISSGSADNVDLLRNSRADVALVQNNTAAQAALGAGPFEREGPYYGLRALASLFPEPLHVVVAKDSPIESIGDLAGKRVEIGEPRSGTRMNSISLLDAAGLSLSDLQAIHETGLENGLRMLSKGEIDVVIGTVSAPARTLQRAMATNSVRLLSLPPDVLAELAKTSPEFVPILLPTSTYPNQAETVNTIAVTALLVAPEGLTEVEVDQVLTTLFDKINFLGAGSAAGSLITRASAKLGVTIPMHPAAIEFFGGQETDSAPEPPAAESG